MSYKECISEEGRTSIINHCLGSDHAAFKLTACNSCFNDYFIVGGEMKSICDREQHVKLKYNALTDPVTKSEVVTDYFLCSCCHESAVTQALCRCVNTCTEICRNSNICDHGCVRTLTSLQPISVGIVGVSNYEYDREYTIPTSQYKKKRKIFTEKTFIGSGIVGLNRDYLTYFLSLRLCRIILQIHII